MRLAVSEERCTGHGRCYALAPEVYAPDDEGYNAAAGAELEVPKELEERAARGMRGCPEKAIQLVKQGVPE